MDLRGYLAKEAKTHGDNLATTLAAMLSPSFPRPTVSEFMANLNKLIDAKVNLALFDSDNALT